ncbi:hypothetical protein ADUPG1_013988 [Aduncisulcus paluster]|uniref:Protein kinase domain-containing protein n=1 Tax=Aduncisulcus paluster TaxID=2918883 RepID=A0ABQ5K554_9EUKA|nr:hypothetical protein ADUPG1_013988 [Aduncisulcus paluster]
MSSKDTRQLASKIGSKPKYKPKRDSLTLTSSSTITPQCIIGNGGFAEVLLVKIDDIPFLCVLKKMLRIADKTVVKGCRKEFKVQRKLFNNPKCFHRIPRPLYILDLLDGDFKGVYGFLMEYCAGGSVSSFAKTWCADGKSMRTTGTEEDSDASSSDSSSESSVAECHSHIHFDPMSLDSVKVSALCVGMIECLDDVFTAKPRLIHRDIKPDNFLVRADPESKKCTIVLSDLGIAQIQNSISSSSVVKSFASSTLLSSSSSQPHKEDPSICGTLVYNSCEALQGMHSQESDAYSLGMTILAVFEGCDPFFHSPVLQGLKNRVEFATKLRNSILEGLGPKLSNSCLFRSLQTIEGGKYTPVFECLNDVFEGLTKVDIGKRMSVHKARERVQSIKRLLPDIGEGWKYPSIDDIVRLQLKKHGNNPGIIIKGGGGEKQSGLMSLMTMTTTSSSSSSSSSESSLPVGKRRFRGVNISTKVSKAPVTIMTQTSSTIMTSIVELIEKTKKTTSTEHVSFLFKKSVPNLCSIFSSLELDDAILSNHELYTKCFECLSLFVEHLALDSASSSVFLDKSSIKMLIDSLFEDMVRVEKILNPTENEDEKEKEEEEEEEEKEMSIATKSLFSIAVTAENRVESFRGKLIRQIPSVVDRFLNHILLDIYKCYASDTLSKLYYKQKNTLLSIFLGFQSSKEIKVHKSELVMCCTCLDQLLSHEHLDCAEKWISLPMEDRFDLFESFIDHIVKSDELLEGAVEEELCSLMAFHSNHIDIPSCEPLYDSLFPVFHRILERGSKHKLKGFTGGNFLRTLLNLAHSTSISLKLSIIDLAKSYFEPWMKVLNHDEVVGCWMAVLAQVSKGDFSLCSEVWPLFGPVIDIVRKDFVRQSIIVDGHEHVLRFLSNLCCDPSYIPQIYDKTKDLLHGWYVAIKKENHKFGIQYWSELISRLCSVSSLVPKISPKFDIAMEWCNCNNGGEGSANFSRYTRYCYPDWKGWNELCLIEKYSAKVYDELKKDDLLEDWFKVIEKSDNQLAISYWADLVSMLSTCPSNVSHLIPKFDSAMKWCYDNNLDCCDSYCVYLSNCDPNLRQWGDLLFSIRQCSDSASTARLYHDNRQAILSVFRRFRTIMSEFLDEEFSTMCVNYTDNLFCRYKSRFQDSFLPKIISNFENLLKRGSEGKLGKNVATNVTITLHNFCNCHSSGTKTSIIRLINPYFKRWLKKYPDSCILGDWMCVLAYVTWSSEENAPNESICAEAWSLFDPVVDIVKKEFVGKKITKDYHEYALLFFANLCCDPAHALQVFKKTSDQLLKWCKIFEKVKGPGIFIWGKLISMFSTIPSLVSKIYPEFEVFMELIAEGKKLEELSLDSEHLRWFKTVPARSKREKTIFGGDFKRYIRNCKK